MSIPDSQAPQGFREKRSVPRYMLIATVEVEESTSGVRISGRVSEISRKGCYIDVLNTLPTGTMVRLRVIRDKGTFFTRGKIIYVHVGIGMGVLFVDPTPDQLQILDSWIADLAA
jgi:PilZ domain